MRKGLKELVVVCAVLLAAGARGQGTYFHDYEQWLSLKLSGQYGKNWSVSGQYVVRNYGFLEAFKGSYYYAQARYAIDKHWYPDAQIRVVNTHFDDAFRVEVGMMYRLRKKKNSYFVRIAYFNEREHLLPDDRLQHAPDHYARCRLRYRRDLPKKLIGSAVLEGWSKFSKQGPILKRWALTADLQREIFDRHFLSVEYLYQVEYDTDFPVALHALTLGYEFVLTKKKYKRRGGKDNRDDR